MADKVEGIHDKFNGDLDVKVAEIHQLMLSMATINRSPRLGPVDSNIMPPVPWSTSAEASSTASPSIKAGRGDFNTYKHPFTPAVTPEIVGSELSPQSSRALSLGRMSPGNISVNNFDNRPGSDGIPVNDHYRLPSYYNEPPPEYKRDRRTVISDLSTRLSTEPIQNLSGPTARSPSLGALGIQPLSPVTLPPPIIAPEQEVQGMQPRNGSLAITPPAQHQSELARALSTLSQQEMFERRLFGDAATLCETWVTVPEKED